MPQEKSDGHLCARLPDSALGTVRLSYESVQGRLLAQGRPLRRRPHGIRLTADQMSDRPARTPSGTAASLSPNFPHMHYSPAWV